MDGPAIKGTCVLSVLRKLGADGLLERVLDRLDDTQRRVFSDLIIAGLWYPLPAYVALLNAVARERASDIDRYGLDLGRAIINDGLNGLYRVFLKLGSPQFVLRNSPRLWRTYFSGSTLEIIEARAGIARLRVTGDGPAAKALCLSQLGGMIEAAELAGAKNVRARETACRLRNDAGCLFELTWDE